MDAFPDDLIVAAFERLRSRDETESVDFNASDMDRRIRQDPLLQEQVKSASAELLRLRRERETIGRFVRDAVDPSYAYAVGAKAPTDYFDLFQHALIPVARFLSRGLRSLLSFSAERNRTPGTRYPRLLVALLALIGACLAVLSPRGLARSLLTLIFGVVVVCVFGAIVRIVQSLRFRDEIRLVRAAPAKFIDVVYQRRIDAIVKSDPDYIEADSKFQRERERVIALIADSLLSDARQRVPANAHDEEDGLPIEVTECDEPLFRDLPIDLSDAPPSSNGTAFISYVRDDSRKVARLRRELAAAGVDVWLDKERLLPGTRWREALQANIASGSFFLACFSANSESRVRSYMREELALAVDEIRLRPRDRAWFIPIILTPCEIPPLPLGMGETIRDIQFVSLCDNWRGGVERLVRVMGTRLTSSPPSDSVDPSTLRNPWHSLLSRALRSGKDLRDLIADTARGATYDVLTRLGSEVERSIVGASRLAAEGDSLHREYLKLCASITSLLEARSAKEGEPAIDRALRSQVETVRRFRSKIDRRCLQLLLFNAQLGDVVARVAELSQFPTVGARSTKASPQAIQSAIGALHRSIEEGSAE